MKKEQKKPRRWEEHKNFLKIFLEENIVIGWLCYLYSKWISKSFVTFEDEWWSDKEINDVFKIEKQRQV